MRIRLQAPAEAGFTLVEIMIASGLTIVMALVIATMMFNSSKQQKRIEDRANQADFVQGAALDIRLKPVP